MATFPLLGPTPTITPGGHIHSPPVDTCFACSPKLKLPEHKRHWIPVGRTPRTLVLCFDGTGDSFDHDNSNIVQLLAMLKKDEPSQQLVYYQAGIGTYTSSVVKTPIRETVYKTWDAMFASGLAHHVKAGYTFLMQNYRAGDHICIFGFSRGACTARILAGMIQKVGLLPPCNFEQLPFAYSMYTKNDKESLESSMAFKRTFSIDVRIKFVGVWDTVDSVGMVPKHFAFSTSNNTVEHFRHAIALDEHRVKFIPSYFTGGETEKEKKERKARERDESVTVSGYNEAVSEETPLMIEERTASESSFKFEKYVNKTSGQVTDVKEVFFAGAHCDVGGGSVLNGRRHSLARIPLRWMIRECFNLETGIIFDAHMLKHEVGLDIDIKYEERPATDTKVKERLAIESISKPPQSPLPETNCLMKLDTAEIKGFSLLQVPVAVGSAIVSPFRWAWRKVFPAPPKKRRTERFMSEGEETETLKDALCPIFDQFKKHPHWRILDWCFLVTKKHRAELDGSDDLKAYKFAWNRGKGRKVYREVIKRGMNVHRSVRTRMLALPAEGEKEQYWPNVRCELEGARDARRPTREEWLANEPTFFNWVD